MDSQKANQNNEDNGAAFGITIEQSIGVAIVYFIFIFVAAPLNYYIARALYQLPLQVKRSVNDNAAMFWSIACAFYAIFFLPLRIIRIVLSAVFLQIFISQDHLVNSSSHVSERNVTGNPDLPLHNNDHNTAIIFMKTLCWINFVGETIIIAFFCYILIVTPILRGLYVFSPVFMFKIYVRKWAKYLLAGGSIFIAMLVMFSTRSHRWVETCIGTSPHTPVGKERASTGYVAQYSAILVLICGLNFGIHSAILIYLQCSYRKLEEVNTSERRIRRREPVHTVPLVVNIIQGLGFLIQGVVSIELYFGNSNVNPWVQNKLPSLLSAFLAMVLVPCVTLFASHRIRPRCLKNSSPSQDLSHI